MTRGDRWPYECMAHPRPDQTQPGDDPREAAAWIAWAICVFVFIVVMSSVVPA